MPTNCAACSEALPDGARFCLRCGAPAGGAAPAPGEDWAGGVPPPPVPAKKMSTLVIVLIVVGCLVLCGIPAIAIVAAIAIPNLLAAKLSANETAAIATLRNLASCQAQVQTSGKIDVDEDGIGEYGTFLELTGTVGVRAPGSADWSKKGPVVSPPVSSPALAQVDRVGIVTKSGYAFAIFLPDATGKGWVHETGPAATAALSGPVGTDAAEVRWCAYAWPIARGNSGNRCFFVNEAGDVLQSPNEAYPHVGAVGLPDPGSAFLPGTMNLAIGTIGADGNEWKVTN